MKNLKQLCLVLSVGGMTALSIAACGDDTTPPPGTAGTTGTAGTGTAGTGTAGTGTAGTGTAGTGTAGTGTAGTGTAGTGTAGTGTAGTASGGTGGASGGTGGASGGSGGKGGSGGASGGSGGAGGGSGPMCADIDGPSTDSATCATYCTDAVATCGAESNTMMKVKDAQTCATFCATFTQTQLCCRAYHVKNAATQGKDPHCKHAVGIEMCQ
ncbi:MAG: hypothetical protein ABUL60_10200 [Myxococcales bacterium]